MERLDHRPRNLMLPPLSSSNWQKSAATAASYSLKRLLVRPETPPVARGTAVTDTPAAMSAQRAVDALALCVQHEVDIQVRDLV